MQLGCQDKLVTYVLKIVTRLFYDLSHNGSRLCNVASLMVFFLSSLVTYELFLVSRFQIKRD